MFKVIQEEKYELVQERIVQRTCDTCGKDLTKIDFEMRYTRPKNVPWKMHFCNNKKCAKNYPHQELFDNERMGGSHIIKAKK